MAANGSSHTALRFLSPLRASAPLREIPLCVASLLRYAPVAPPGLHICLSLWTCAIARVFAPAHVALRAALRQATQPAPAGMCLREIPFLPFAGICVIRGHLLPLRGCASRSLCRFAALELRSLPTPMFWNPLRGLHGGEGGIRTHGTLRSSGFQDRRIRPLCHLSLRLRTNAPQGSGRQTEIEKFIAGLRWPVRCRRP